MSIGLGNGLGNYDMNQNWPCSMTSYGVSGPHWVNMFFKKHRLFIKNIHISGKYNENWCPWITRLISLDDLWSLYKYKPLRLCAGPEMRELVFEWKHILFERMFRGFNSLWASDTMWHRSGSTWGMLWLVSWRHQAITCANVDFSIVRFCGIQQSAILQRSPKLLSCIMSLKIILLRLAPHLPGTTELI